MVDFANSKNNLVNTFSTRETDRGLFEVTPLDPVGTSVIGADTVDVALTQANKRASSLAPQTFDPSMNVVLSEEIKQGIADTRAAEKAARNTKRENNAVMLQTMYESNKEIAEAQANVDTITSVPFAHLLGLFNDDYSYSKQNKRIKDAQNQVTQQGKVNQVKMQNSLLNVEDAQAPLKEFESLQKARKGFLDNTAAQMSAITASNTALKAYRDFAFDMASPEELNEIEKSGNFDEVFSPGAIKEYKNKQRKFDLNMRSLALANAQNDLQLKNMLEDEVLEQTSQYSLEVELENTKQAGKHAIELANGQTISLQKAEAALIKKSETNQKRIKEVNSFSTMNTINVNSFKSTLQDVSAVSNLNNTSGIAVDTAGYNLLNTTVESLQTFDFESLNPYIRQETADFVLHAAQLNAQDSTTRDDVIMQTQKREVLQKKLDELKVMQIENAPDKQTERATKEWLTNGYMSNGKNAAAVTMNMIGSRPNFGGDQALQEAFKIFETNMIAQAGGGGRSFVDEDGNIDTNALLASTIKIGQQSKTVMVQNALRKKDEFGMTPVSAYVSNKSPAVMWTALEELSQQYPEVRQTFFPEDRGSSAWITPQGGQDHGAVAIELAKLAATNPRQEEMQVNYLNYKLGDIINKLVATSSKQMNSQVNMSRGAFMVNLFNEAQPSEVLDNALQYSYFNNINSAWDGVLRDRENPQSAQDQKLRTQMQGGFK